MKNVERRLCMNEIKDILLMIEKDIKKLLGNDLRKIIVYGSYARGDYDENSDIDIMILSSLPESSIEKIEETLCDKVFDILMSYGVQISIIVKNEDHFNYWLGALPFYDNVNREGVTING